MICLHGKVVCGGMVSGTAYIFNRDPGHAAAHKPVSRAEEQSRLERALTAVNAELSACAAQAENDTARDIYEIHRMMLEDADILDALRSAIQNGAATEDAVYQTEEIFAQMFRDTGDDYMIARIDDIRDVCGRLTAHLSGQTVACKVRGPVVLAADVLLPGDLTRFGKENLTGVVMGSGSVYSHISILLKEMGIPALICENIHAAENGMPVLLDADNGTVYFEPDSRTAADFMLAQRLAAETKKVSAFSRLPCKLCVNIGDPQEVTAAILAKCDGIGLFRTEYLFFGRADLPGEEEQFAVYRDILKKANDKPVTVRTFDIGSDKTVEALPLEKEENPALGFRGLRVYSLYPDVFKTQLRALLRAAVYGDLRVMFPMVTSCGEIKQIDQVLLQAAQELAEQGIPYKMPLRGAMLETPAAVLLSERLAETVDFFSVGTNDLAQYIVAMDRQNGRLDSFSDPTHEALRILIRTAAENAHRHGIEIGICGALAAAPELTEAWIEMGIDSLSVPPAVL